MDNFLRQTAAGQAAGSPEGPEAQHPPNLSGYRTGRLLGTGSSASVWLVEDQRTGTESALKVFAASMTRAGIGPEAGKEQVSQLNREIAVLGALNHPHLLGLRDVVSTDLGPAILMDYAGGGSLLNLVIARGRLSVGESITVLAPIAHALAYLHSASVQHGDVSPGNVLFTAEGKPLLADLGVGRLLGEADTRPVGTAGFTDTGHGIGLSAGYASDVYSLAAIGWYALTGCPPGPAKERVPLTLLVPDVPAELLHILEAGLHEDPEERPTAAETADAVLRSAAPQPLDLVAAVHPSVLPELLTRRATGDEVQGPRRRFPVALERIRPRRPISKGVAPKPESREVGRRRGRRRVRSRIRWSSAVSRTVAALLVLCGALLVGPYVLSTIGNGTSGAGQGPAADQDAGVAGEQGGEGESARQQAVAEAKIGSGPFQQGVELSPELRERLAAADPVKALSALVAVRAMALTTGDAGLLFHINVEDSEAMAADRDLVSGLKERGHVFSGLSIRLQEAALTDSIAVPEGAAAVTATAIMSGYTETDSTGAVVREVAQSTPQDLVFVLVKQAEIWKIASVHSEDTV